MARNIGPRIGIEGEAEYRSQIVNIIQQARTLSSEMQSVTSGFDDSTTAQERAAAQGAVLERQIDVQRDRVKLLAQMVARSAETYGENHINMLQWQEALNTATAELRRMERQLNELPDELEDVEDAMEDAADSTFSFGDALTVGGIIEGVKAIADAIGGVIEQTEEYRKVHASLKVSSADAGYTAEQTAQSYECLQGVLGDEQSAATATANLQALHLEQDKLQTLIAGTIGAWAKYGDSIPIDGLAEAINETVKAGKVTGTFADVLTWAGQSEDDFNKKLEKAKTEAERVELVMQALAEQGLPALGQAWQDTNKSIVDGNLATERMNQVYTRIAEKAAPMVNSLRLQAADWAMELMDDAEDLAAELTELVESGDPLLSVFTGVAAAAGTLAGALAMTKIISGATTAFNTMKTAALALNAALAANPIILVVTLLAGLGAALVTLYQTNEEFRESVDAAWAGIKAAVMPVVDAIDNAQDRIVDGAIEMTTKLQTGIENAVVFLENLPERAREWGSDMLDEFMDGILEKFPNFMDVIEQVAQGASAYLHFSVPDIGPLSDADEYGPDFMELLASGIKSGIPEVRAAAMQAADAMVISPTYAAAGGTVSNVKQYGDFTIYVYAAEGQSPQAVADTVMERIYEAVVQKEEVFA